APRAPTRRSTSLAQRYGRCEMTRSPASSSTGTVPMPTKPPGWRIEVVARENVEVVREMYEAFNRGDAESALELLHPEPELHQSPEVVDAEAYIGLEAFLRGMSLFTEDWDDPRLEPR